jgi:lysophospholipase L1-like esterase
MGERRRSDGSDNWFDPVSDTTAPAVGREHYRRPPAAAGRRRPPAAVGGRRLVPAGSVLVAGLLGLSLALFLNAASLQRTARAMPFGAQRTLAVAAIRPVAALSHLLFLDRPSSAALVLLGRSAPAEESGNGLRDLGLPTAATTALRRPTVQRPLRIWVGGDSMAQNSGAQVVQYAQESGVMKATLDYHISTGLSRPDYYDWPRRLAYVSRVLQPDVAVAFFGANDAQAVDFDGRVLGSESAAWDALYGQRVGQAMDTLRRGGATRVYWVGLPIMGSKVFSRTVRVLDTIYRREAATRPGVVYVDTWSMFAAPGGGYSAYLRDTHGGLQLMRQSDGVHVTLAGASRLGWAIVARIRRDYHVGAGAPGS